MPARRLLAAVLTVVVVALAALEPLCNDGMSEACMPIGTILLQRGGKR